MKRIKGKVLWWSERDENGIIVDCNKYEYYFDSSVLVDKDSKINHLDDVDFILNLDIEHCRCAKDVNIKQ